MPTKGAIPVAGKIRCVLVSLVCSLLGAVMLIKGTLYLLIWQRDGFPRMGYQLRSDLPGLVALGALFIVALVTVWLAPGGKAALPLTGRNVDTSGFATGARRKRVWH
jgi:hypothetical protein